MTDDPIARLLEQVAAQDRAAFRTLYSATSSKLFGVLLRILVTRAEAEDALQEVFTRVWLKAGRFEADKGRGMTWLITIARYHAIDRRRARGDRVTDGEDALLAVADTTPGPAQQVEARSEASRITRCFDTLEGDRAAAVKGAYLNGQTYQDLARTFNVPLNTMRTWLRRSLQKLKECLEA